MEMDDAPLTRDILGNLLEEPEIIEDDTSQNENKDNSKLKKIGTLIVGIFLIILFLFALWFIIEYIGGILGIIIIIGLLGSVPKIFLTGKF